MYSVSSLLCLWFSVADYTCIASPSLCCVSALSDQLHMYSVSLSLLHLCFSVTDYTCAVSPSLCSQTLEYQRLHLVCFISGHLSKLWSHLGLFLYGCCEFCGNTPNYMNTQEDTQRSTQWQWKGLFSFPRRNKGTEKRSGASNWSQVTQLFIMLHYLLTGLRNRKMTV